MGGEARRETMTPLPTTTIYLFQQLKLRYQSILLRFQKKLFCSQLYQSIEYQHYFICTTTRPGMVISITLLSI